MHAHQSSQQGGSERVAARPLLTLGQEQRTGGTYECTKQVGGGLYCDGEGSGNACSPRLAHLILSGNRAGAGGALFNAGARNGLSSPTLADVIFTGNSAQHSGGAVYNWAWLDGISSPTLTNVTFSQNGAERGGGMFNFGYREGVSSPTLANVVFINNAADHRGGGLYADGVEGESSPTLINVTLSGNSAHSGGGLYASGLDGESSPTLINVILWGNTATWHGDQMFNESAATIIGHSLVEGGWNGDGIYNVDSTVADQGGNIDDDPQLRDAESGNVRLLPVSPAIDAGDNDAVPTSVTTDLAGRPRFADVEDISDTGHGTPPIVDIGAYEMQPMQTSLYLPLAVRNHY